MFKITRIILTDKPFCTFSQIYDLSYSETSYVRGARKQVLKIKRARERKREGVGERERNVTPDSEVNRRPIARVKTDKGETRDFARGIAHVQSPFRFFSRFLIHRRLPWRKRGLHFYGPTLSTSIICVCELFHGNSRFIKSDMYYCKIRIFRFTREAHSSRSGKVFVTFLVAELIVSR